MPYDKKGNTVKLLVIVLCLLSERFIVHGKSHHRFSWFATYEKHLIKYLSNVPFLSSPIVLLVGVLLPIFILTTIAFSLFAGWIFGFVGLLFNIFIFYYCLGPTNPFYPVRQGPDENMKRNEAGDFLSQTNSQLFAVLFWYIVSGPLFILMYRLLSLSQKQRIVGKLATSLTQLLDWMPARMAALLYLLVGHFQAGRSKFAKLFFSAPAKNHTLLSTCGVLALGVGQNESVQMTEAESLVEHAVIALLVLLAVFTLVAWV